MQNEENGGAAAPAGQNNQAVPQNSQSAPAPQPAEAPTLQPQIVPAKRKGRGVGSKYVVEAALFSAGKPLSVKDMQEATALPKWEIIDALAVLMDAYDKYDGAIEISKAGDKYAMQVKARYAQSAAKLAPMEIAPKLLKTLALIAYHQPIKQSQLLRMIGPRVYDHVPELCELGLVSARDDGQTKTLSATSTFPEYFGIDATKPEEIKKFLAKKVGIAIKDMENAEKRTIEAAAHAESKAEQKQEQTAQTAQQAQETQAALADADTKEAQAPTEEKNEQETKVQESGAQEQKNGESAAQQN